MSDMEDFDTDDDTIEFIEYAIDEMQKIYAVSKTPDSAAEVQLRLMSLARKILGVDNHQSLYDKICDTQRILVAYEEPLNELMDKQKEEAS